MLSLPLLLVEFTINLCCLFASCLLLYSLDHSVVVLTIYFCLQRFLLNAVIAHIYIPTLFNFSSILVVFTVQHLQFVSILWIGLTSQVFVPLNLLRKLRHIHVALCDEVRVQRKVICACSFISWLRIIKAS